MPGFSVAMPFDGALGDGPTGGKPYYSYTWTVPHLFGDNISSIHAAIYAQSCTLPAITHRREEVEGSSLVYKVAKDVIWEDVRISFYDVNTETSEGTICKALKKWRSKVWSLENGIGSAEGPDGYKKDTQIAKTTYDGTLEEKWKLKGSWPQAVKFGELTYTDSTVNIVDVTVTYDWAEESI